MSFNVPWWVYAAIFVFILVVGIIADRYGQGPKIPKGRHAHTGEFEVTRVRVDEDLTYRVADKVEPMEAKPPVPSKD